MTQNPPVLDPAGVFIAKALNLVDNSRGVKAKVETLRTIATSGQDENAYIFTQVLKYAYDGGIRFGISADKITVPQTLGNGVLKQFDHWVFKFLDEVAATGSLTAKQEMIEHELEQMSQMGRDILMRIIAKDLRVGINESTITKAFPSLLSIFDVMLAKPFNPKKVSAWPVLVEPKLDGLRVIAEADTVTKEVNFFTRSGKPITSLDNYKQETLAFAYQFTDAGIVVFDGEVTSGTFAESMSSVRGKSEQATDATFHVFDVLVGEPGRSPIAQDDKVLEEQGTQAQRRHKLNLGYLSLKKHISEPKFIKPTGAYTVSTADEVMIYYNRCRDAGLEGVIVKDPGAFYVKKRSQAWGKIKAEETADLEIIGAFEGEGQFVGSLGGLIVSNKGVEVKVGSGFSAQQRAEFWAQYLIDMGHIASGNRDRCRLLHATAEVQFQEELPSGSLRHPVFVRLRHDKGVIQGSF